MPTASTHEDEINQYQVGSTSDQTSLTANQTMVQNICDCLQVPPPLPQGSAVSQLVQVVVYTNACVAAASAVGNPVPADVSAVGNSHVSQKGISIGSAAGDPSAVSGDDSVSAEQNRAQLARSNVLDQVNAIETFINAASAAGFGTPNNPFNVIASLNSARGFTFVQLNVSSAAADQVISDINTFIGLLAQQASGQISFSDQLSNSTQLSSAEISLAGFGGTGDPSTDLAQFLPSLDSIQEAQAQAALSVLNFANRIPQMLFTLDYAPDGPIKGSVICWKRIPDAAGYILNRHSLFENVDVSFTLSNDDLDASYSAIEDYVNTWGLGFYDNISEANVYAYLDPSVDPNQYYFYSLVAYQIQKTIQGSVFERATTPIAAHWPNIYSVPAGNSPYPTLSQALLGSPDYDWLLAGLNIQASIDRKDPSTTTRKYSYVNADINFLFQQMGNNLFVRPAPGDLNQLAQDITSNISTYGVIQVIEELLLGTGIFYYFEGVDPADQSYFSNLVATDPDQSNLMAGIAAAIDPSTATIDLSALSTNLTNILNGQGSSLVPFSPLSQATPQEIDVPPNGGASSQTPSAANTSSNQVVDLTTFTGLSQFIQTIRTVANVSPYLSPSQASFSQAQAYATVNPADELSAGKAGVKGQQNSGRY